MLNLFPRFSLATLLAASLLLTTMACDKDDDDDNVQPTVTLYDKLGKVEGVTAVVTTFTGNVAGRVLAGDTLFRTFQPLVDEVVAAGGAETPRLRLLNQNLIDQIGEAAGGPLKYKGKSMREAHRGMALTDASFNALVAQLQAAMTTKGVSAANQTELVTVLAGLKGQIVGQ